MKKVIIIFSICYLSSLLLTAKPNTPNSCSRLAEMQHVIDRQRNEADSIIKNSNLSDSVRNKPYCVFYISGCRGIGGWIIVVSDHQDYHVYYTDSFESAQGYLYKTICISKDNEDMQLLFSQISLKGSKRRLDYREWYLTYYYFGLFDVTGNLSFDWNQSIWFQKVEVQNKVLNICLKFIMPYLI